MNQDMKTLEFTAIRGRLADLTLCEVAREKALALTPYMREAELRGRLEETTGARKVLEGLGTPPLSPMETVHQSLQLAMAGGMLAPELLYGIAGFITTCTRMQGYLRKADTLDAAIASYSQAIHSLGGLRDEIERCIRVDTVDDHASPLLRDIRRSIEAARDGVKGKLESMLRSKKEYFSEGFIVTRGERFALPVKKQYKNQVPGTVLDVSSTGSTVFIEPTQARKLMDDIASLQIDEENEICRILYTLSAEVADNLPSLRANVSTMEALDFVFAKAKLSAQMQAVEPIITTERRIEIRNGRHPLLDPEKAVPLNFAIGGDIQGVIITGPNTGGKTVTLKTVGLLSLMAQSGLHVPAGEGSVFGMQANVLCDIGDGQSILENLSTFSSHMTNIIRILSGVTHESLVLLDELGSGTDPAEGMGLAVSILEELRAIGCLLLCTSHYPEIKEYAAKTPGLTNARMAFDRESLAPMYRLEMGEAGESCALYIAQRLGFPQYMIERARKAAYAATTQEARGDIAGSAIPEAKRQKAASRIEKHVPRQEVTHGPGFQRGDSVRVYPEDEIGIVYEPADDKGMVRVQVKGKKIEVNHKRLKLLVSADVLYPDDYDFSIVFDTVANRKARHKLDKGNPTGVIEY